MPTYNFTGGRAANKAAGQCDVTGIDLWPMQYHGAIVAGSDVHVSLLPGTYTGQDVCWGVRNFNLFLTAPWGAVTLDCTPIAPRTSSQLFPYTTLFNASWGQKAAILFWDGDVHIGPGITIKNATYGTGYGNIAAIRKNATTGAPTPGSLYLDGVEIYGCDNGILATPNNAPGDVVVIKNTNLHDNGAGDGQSHNLYIGEFDLFLFLNSISINAKIGHNLKSLAHMNVIGWSDLRDTDVPAKAASYCLDMNGGTYLVRDTLFGQGLNDSNQSVMSFFQTDRIGEGPHELFLLGNTWLSKNAYRGWYCYITNRYLDPTQSFLIAPQLAWNDLTVCIDGNDFQYVDRTLDYGATAGNALVIPSNTGVTNIAGTNRRIATTDPSAGTPYANVDPAKLAQSSIGDIVAGLGYADYDSTVIAALLARSLSLQAAWTPPTDDPPVVDPPPAPEPPEPDPPTHQVKIFRSSDTFTVSGSITNLKVHIWGGGQAGESGTYSAGVAVAGGKGGASSSYAQYAPVLQPADGTVFTFTKGDGGVTSLEAGGNSELEVGAVVVARAIGGDNTGTPVGTLNYAGSAGGDPTINSAPPPDPYTPAHYGMGGAGAPGEHGLGGKGADQANYQPLAPPSGGLYSDTYFYGDWYFVTDESLEIGGDTLTNPSALFDTWVQCGAHIVVGVLDNGGGNLAFSGGGNADAGNGTAVPWVDAPEYTDVGTVRYAGNGGGVNADRSSFFTVHGNGVTFPHSGASAGQGNAPRSDDSVNAYGGDGQQYADTFVTDSAGPGSGAAGLGGILFSRTYDGDPGGPFDFSGFAGGDFGAGGSGAPAIWDFGANGFSANFTLGPGKGGEGGMIVEWDEGSVTPTPTTGRRWLNVSGPIYR